MWKFTEWCVIFACTCIPLYGATPKESLTIPRQFTGEVPEQLFKFLWKKGERAVLSAEYMTDNCKKSSGDFPRQGIFEYKGASAYVSNFPPVRIMSFLGAVDAFPDGVRNYINIYEQYREQRVREFKKRDKAILLKRKIQQFSSDFSTEEEKFLGLIHENVLDVSNEKVSLSIKNGRLPGGYVAVLTFKMQNAPWPFIPGIQRHCSYKERRSFSVTPQMRKALLKQSYDFLVDGTKDGFASKGLMGRCLE